MNSRERLMATLRGEQVDRPAVSFYEIGGFAINPSDPNPFNIYSDPSWQPLLRLAEEQTDIIRMRGPKLSFVYEDVRNRHFSEETYMKNGSKFVVTRIKAGGREFTSLTRRDPDVDTIWTLKHFLSDADDLKAYLTLPDEAFIQKSDTSNLLTAEEAVGDRGIVMVDVPDPLVLAAQLFSMEDYTIIALTEPELFHTLLEKYAKNLHRIIEQVSEQFPGRLWRICGPEYACEPYLPPRLFNDYVVRYAGPMVKAIQKHGGFARIHCHGRLKAILPYIAEMGADGLDPVEPPTQGDVELEYVRREYGQNMVLFGNLEITDIENMDSADFEKVVARALTEGTAGRGRGFVLMPSASPYGRTITPRTLANYKTMVRLAKECR